MNCLPFIIRAVSPSDVPRAIEIFQAGFDSYLEWAPPGWEPPVLGDKTAAQLETAYARPDAWCGVAVVDGLLIGVVSLSKVTGVQPEPAPENVINLWQLFVSPEWQGSGVAASLMGAAVEEAAKRGFEWMRLWTPRDAKRARRFYEREGWSLSGEERPADQHLGLAIVEYVRELA